MCVCVCQCSINNRSTRAALVELTKSPFLFVRYFHWCLALLWFVCEVITFLKLVVSKAGLCIFPFYFLLLRFITFLSSIFAEYESHFFHAWYFFFRNISSVYRTTLSASFSPAVFTSSGKGAKCVRPAGPSLFRSDINNLVIISGESSRTLVGRDSLKAIPVCHAT